MTTLGKTVTDVGAFAIRVIPSPSTNDHEVRLLADGEDLIDRFWDDLMGMDPDELLLDPCPLLAPREGRRVTVARCTCGVAGCGSAEVTVMTQAPYALWVYDEMVLRFPLPQYEAEVRRAQADTSWETADRAAARIVRQRVDRARLARNDLTFDWASGRVRPRTLTASLRRGTAPDQILVDVPWKDETPEAIAEVLLAAVYRHSRG